MSDLLCPICGDETEVDQGELEGAEVIECEECGAEFPFTIVDGKIFLGPEVDGWDGSTGEAILIEDEDAETICEGCGQEIHACDCDNEGDEGDA
jgi:predicted nucleic acid-binding Zn ribbon protein